MITRCICLLISVFLFSFAYCQTVPPRTIPDGLYAAFTMNGAIPVIYAYSNDTYKSDQPIVYTTEQLNQFINLAKAKQTAYYGPTDLYLYQALEKYLNRIQNKEVAVIGSVIPWYESILLAYGASPTIIEYNKIVSSDPRLKIFTPSEFDANPYKFEAILSISSYEHDGLGRYGDPVNPIGDLQAMQKAKSMLKENGLLFLSVPVGKDCLVWNLHRVYGQLRLKALLKGWRVLGYYGFTFEDLDKDHSLNVHQPVFVLTPMK